MLKAQRHKQSGAGKVGKERKLKKILTVIIIGILCLSMFSIFSPKIKAPEVSIDTIIVQSDGLTYHSSVVLQAGVTYIIEAVGMYKDEPDPGSFTDAQYYTKDGWITNHMNDRSPYVGQPTGGLYLEGWSLNYKPWGSYNSEHKYEYIYTGNNEQVGFWIYDSWYPGGPPGQNGVYDNNSGYITVNIYLETLPVGYWKFDERSGNIAYDSSGNGNYGTIYGATWTTGRLGAALSFDGNGDYVEIPQSSVLDFRTSISIEAWVKVAGTTGDHQVIVAKWYPGGNTDGSYVLEFQPDGRTPQFVLRTTGRVDTVSSVLVSFGSWEHIAATYDGAVARIYVNGELAGSQYVTGEITVGNQLFIGAHLPAYGDQNWFSGVIDEVAIYNYARTQEEILNDYGVYDLALTDFSPVQVVYGASVLVADKPTKFRAIVHNTFPSQQSVRIRFIYNGGATADYLTTIQPNSVKSVFIPFGDSYILPSEGTITYSAQLDPNNSIPETNETNNYQEGSARVKTSSILKTLYVPYFDLSEIPIDWNTLNNMREASDLFLNATFPVGESKYASNAGPIYFPSLPSTNPITFRLALISYELTGLLLGYNQTVVVVPDDYQLDGNWLHHWLLDPPFGVPYGAAGWQPLPHTVVVENGYWKDVAHELGHIYGLPVGMKEEYPAYWEGRDSSGYWVKPSVDPSTGKYLNGEIIDGGCFMGGAIYKSYSYSAFRRVWVDNEDYEKLLSRLLLNSQDPELIYVSGIVFINDTVKIGPWMRLPSGVPDIPLNANGNYTLRFLDNTGSIIAQTGFNVTFEQFGQPSEFASFSLTVPYVQGSSQVQVVHDGSPIATKTVSQHPPTTQMISPNGGEVFVAGENVTINWNASDLDGDNMTFVVAYSADGGQNWVPLAADLNQTGYIWNNSYLHKGSSYLVKIIATDGVNTGEDVSNSTFTIKVHDVATTNVTSSKTVVGEGYNANVNATLVNVGDFTETFNVTAYANTTLIGKQEVTLGAGGNTTIAFNWDTTGLTKGNYTISGFADPVGLEFFTTDNTFKGGNMMITIQGDVNGDKIVNVLDLHALAKAYNVTSIDPPWRSELDINNDLIINTEDLRIIDAHYGQSW